MTELEQELMNLLKEEREKNHALTLLLLEKEGKLESNTTVIVPENTQGRGTLPWHLRKSMLERMFAKKTEELKDAS